MRTWWEKLLKIPTKPGVGPFLPAPQWDLEESPILSFCITHKNRFKYLKETLVKNLEDNRHQSSAVEFVVMDFNEDSQVEDWIWSECSSEIRTGYLKYFHSEMPGWSSPVAKNTAHYVANGRILTNLDCDNFTGKGGGRFVIDQYKADINNLMLWQFSRVRRDGSFGRISFYKEMFDALGGYDENLMEMGFQDNDIMNRALAMGVKRIEINDKKYNRAIKHEKYSPVNISFKQMNKLNAQHSRANIAAGKWRANNGIYGIRNGLKVMNDDGQLVPFSK